jgi:heat-inducible transcriptional repressor
MRNEELEDRARRVLAVIVTEYIRGGEPVGSKAVTERFPESVSSATIRNCMAELEAAGYLVHPHVSAGRIPTDKAYRYYVDRMLGATRLETALQEVIDHTLSSEQVEPEQLMAKTSRLLARVSGNVGLVLGPAPDEKVLEHIHFVKLPERRALAVIVSKPDLVENKVIHVEEDLPQEELDRIAQYLNGEFCGWSLRTIRMEIFQRLEEMKALCDRLLSNAARLFIWGALAEPEPGPVFLDGTAAFLDRPEFEDARRIKELLATFEEKARLVKILNACMASSSPGVRVFIGRENLTSEMQDCALILAPFRYRSRVVGTLGVVGPMRMEYDHAINTVEYVAHLCSKLLSSN